MFSRPKWSTSILYGVSSACALGSFVWSGINGTLAVDAISISFGVGVAVWGTAAAQEIYRNYTRRSAAANVTQSDLENPATEEDNQWRPSTHARINSALHITAATGFIMSDSAALVTGTTAVLGTRLTGSALWFKGAVLSHALGRGQARQEIDPEHDVEVCKLKSAQVGLVIEAEYLLAAILYGIAIYLDETTRNNPLKVIGNTCWFMAGLYDTLHAAYKNCEKNEKEIGLIQVDPPRSLRSSR